MQKRPLGRSGLSVGVLTLGTMTFGEQNTEAEGHAQLDRAVAAGINLIDTAELYPIPPKAETQGRTEEIIGTWLKARGQRDDVLIASKICGRSERTWFRDGDRECRLTRDQVDEAVEKSLRRLGTDVIDLYQVHWPDRNVTGFGSNPTLWETPEDAIDETAIEDTLGFLAAHVDKGNIRFLGVSNESAWGTMKWLEASSRSGLPRIVSIQNAYNLVNRTFDVALAEVWKREDVGLLAYSALGQGYLTGKYSGGARPAGARKTLFERLQRYEEPGADAIIDAYVALARQAGLDPAQMAIAFAASRPFTTSVILGATSLAQLETDLGAADLVLPADLLKEINLIYRRTGSPCP